MDNKGSYEHQGIIWIPRDMQQIKRTCLSFTRTNIFGKIFVKENYSKVTNTQTLTCYEKVVWFEIAPALLSVPGIIYFTLYIAR